MPPRYERTWYGGVRLAPIEAIVSLHPLSLREDPVRRLHARVADTNAILNQLVASARKPKAIALMTTTRDGGLRLHIATPLLDEIPEKILEDRDMQRRHARFGISSDAVFQRWREQLCPRVRVVDVGEIDRAELAAITDEDDLATAQLAAILGPGSAWSSDPDLTDPGLAEPYVLELVIAIREVCVIDVQVAAASKNVALVTSLGTELVRAIARLDSRGRYLVGGLALAALVGVSVATYRKPELRQSLIHALQRVADAITKEITEAYALREAWADRIPPALALDTPRPERAIARVLAVAPTPLATQEIREVLAARGHPIDSVRIARELRAHPMFVPVEGDLWQLGRHAR